MRIPNKKPMLEPCQTSESAAAGRPTLTNPGTNKKAPMNTKYAADDFGNMTGATHSSPGTENRTGGIAPTIPPDSEIQSREAEFSTEGNYTIDKSDVTPICDVASGAADEDIRAKKHRESALRPFSPEPGQDFYESVYPGSGLWDYRFRWVEQRPFVSLEDVEHAEHDAMQSINAEMEAMAIEEFYDNPVGVIEDYIFPAMEFVPSSAAAAGVYITLDEAIHRLPKVGMWIYDLYDFVYVRDELERRKRATDPAGRNELFGI